MSRVMLCDLDKNTNAWQANKRVVVSDMPTGLQYIESYTGPEIITCYGFGEIE